MLMVSIIFGKSRSESLILEMDGKEAVIPFGENIVICYDDSSIVCIIGELLNVTKGKVIIRQEITNYDIRIPLNEVTKINTNNTPSFKSFSKGFSKGCLIGGGIIGFPMSLMSVQFYSDGNFSEARWRMIFAGFYGSIGATVGGVICGLINYNKDISNLNEYIIGNDNWKIIIK